MATVAVSADSSTNEGSNHFQIKPSPSKKLKREETDEASDADEDYELPNDVDEHELELNIKPDRRTRKRPPISFRIGDVFSGLMGQGNREGNNKEDEARSSSSASTSIISEGGSSARRGSGGRFEPETCQATLERRRKQIEYGKNTEEYNLYAKAVPRENREAYHPRTPNMRRKYSRRAWDGLIRHWRINLHLWSSNPEALMSRTRDKQNESFSSDAPSSSTDHETKVFGSNEEPNIKIEGDDDYPDSRKEVEDVQIKVEAKTNIRVEKQEEVSWFEDTEDYYENDGQDNGEETDDDDDDEDNILVTV